ncbi:CDP-glycerol glycerophosphotransferase family protein [SAR116 cluster bacterium]|nr:CDP-glycerol glycerophosphotransferase family protein [SAR116 cluster bacterium]
MFFRPLVDLIKFNKIEKKDRKIVFYSENESFYKFFSGIIDELINIYDEKVCYVTSSSTDPILLSNKKNITPFYIGSGSIRTIFFALYNSPLLILSMPDLDTFHIKRSPHDVNYIFIPHNICSLHMVFRKKAYNSYDTFFCSGPYHKKEIEETCKIYNLNKIKTLSFGYNKIDELLNKKNNIPSKNKEKSLRTLLIAPSWGKNCILEKYGDRLLTHLVDSKWRVIIRPHPDTVKKFTTTYLKLKEKYNKFFIFEENISGMNIFYDTDVMISDWSGVAFEFAFGLEKPVIFLDVPKKINNEDFKLYKNIPFEVLIREKIGKVISTDEINNINHIINDVYKDRLFYIDRIRKERKKNIYNLSKSSQIGAKYIKSLI